MASNALTAAFHIARKDLAIEFRTRSAFLSALVFSLLGVVVLYFAWNHALIRLNQLAPGVLWVIFVFSGLLGLQRSFAVETADRAIDGLLSTPVDRSAIFLGKMAANLLFVLGVQCITIPALIVFYNLEIGFWLLPLAGVVLLASIGLTAVGTLFSSMAVNTRLAELLLPMLALPFFMPVVVASAKATERLMAGQPLQEWSSWLKLLLAFDLVFVFACALAFPYTFED